MAPAKKRKTVKHVKANWRKTDVADVEEYLEEKRLQERTGGIVAEKKDEQLFFIDAKTTNASTTTTSSTTTTTTDKRIRKIDEPLKCFSNLHPDASVPVANNQRPGELGKKRKKRLPPAKRRQTDPKMVKRLRASLKQFAVNERRKAATKKEEEEGAIVNKDLWADDDDEDDDDDVSAFHKKVTREYRVSVPNSRSAMKLTASLLPHVEVPHPGSSYNPDLKDYVTHMRAANLVEVGKVKEEKKLERELDAKFPDKKDADKLHSNWIKEMSGGLEEEDDQEEKEGEEGVKEPMKKKERKTKQQRRKAKEQKTMKAKLARKRGTKQREQEFGRVNSIKKEINMMERHRTEKMKRKEALQAKRAKAGIVRRLGKTKYDAMDVEVKLTNELVGDLRSLVPEGHLLSDRYDSFKRRNLVAPGQRQKKGGRKFKIKRQEKRAWRAVTLDDVNVPVASVDVPMAIVPEPTGVSS